jgi:hypothetical protein
MRTVAKPYEKIKDDPELLNLLKEAALAKHIPLEQATLTIAVDDNDNAIGNWDAEPTQWPITVAGQEFLVGAASAIPATIAGGAAALRSAGLGPWGAGGIGLATAFGTGLATDAAARKIIKETAPSLHRRLEIGEQESPNAALTGTMLSAGAAQRNLLKQVGSAGLKAISGKQGFTTALSEAPGIAEYIQQGQGLGGILGRHVAMSAGAGGGQDVAQQLYQGRTGHKLEDLDLGRTAKVMALSPVAGGGPSRFGGGFLQRVARNSAVRIARENPPQVKFVDPRLAKREAMIAYGELLRDPANNSKTPDILSEIVNRGFASEPNQEKILTAADAWKANRDLELAKTADPEIKAREAVGTMTESKYDPEYIKWLSKNVPKVIPKEGGGERKPNTREWQLWSEKPEAAEYLEKYKAYKAKEEADALQESSTAKVLPREPEEAPKPGSISKGVGPGEQGEGVTGKSVEAGTEVPPQQTPEELAAAAAKLFEAKVVETPAKAVSPAEPTKLPESEENLPKGLDIIADKPEVAPTETTSPVDLTKLSHAELRNLGDLARKEGNSEKLNLVNAEFVRRINLVPVTPAVAPTPTPENIPVSPITTTVNKQGEVVKSKKPVVTLGSHKSQYETFKLGYSPSQWKRLMGDPEFALALESRRMGLAAERATVLGELPERVISPAAATGSETLKSGTKVPFAKAKPNVAAAGESPHPGIVRASVENVWDKFNDLQKAYSVDDPNTESVATTYEKALGDFQRDFMPDTVKSDAFIRNLGELQRKGVDRTTAVAELAKIVQPKPIQTGKLILGKTTARGTTLYAMPLHIIVKKTAEAITKLVHPVLDLPFRVLPSGEGGLLERFAPAEGGIVSKRYYPLMKRIEMKLQNFILEPVFQIQKAKLADSQLEKIGAYAYDMEAIHTSPIKLTPAEEKVYQLGRTSFDNSRISQIQDGQYINGKPVTALTKDFMPRTVMSKEYRDIFNSQDAAHAAEKLRATDLYTNWCKSQDPKITEKAINENLNHMLGKDPYQGRRNPNFNPLEEAAGLGLPVEMREKNFLHVVQFYGRRSATGLAWYRAIQKDPVAARIFGITDDGRGGSYVDPTQPIGQNTPNPNQYLITDYTPSPKYADNLTGNPHLEAYRAEMGLGAQHNYDWIDQATAVNNAFMLGPWTTFRDIVSSSIGIHGEIAHTSEILGHLKAIERVFTGTSTAAKAGGVRSRKTAEMAIDLSVRKILGKISDAGNKWGGRDLGEKGLRSVLWEFGREITKHRLAENDLKFLETYGTPQWRKLHMDNPEDFLDHCAGRVMETMQGTYGPEHLRKGLLKSSGPGFTKAIFALSRFSIERAHQYRKTVIQPMAEGNAIPFLKSTALYLGLVGPAVNAFIQMVTDRKPRNSTWGEWLRLYKAGKPSVELMDELAYNVLAHASFTGMGGILTGVLYNLEQAYHGERALGYNNPAWAGLNDFGNRVVDYYNAYSGRDLIDNLWRLPWETMITQVQGLRSAAQILEERPDLGKREERIYERMTGKTKPVWFSPYHTNPFSPLTKMRQAQTPEGIFVQEEPLAKMYGNTPPERAGRFYNPVRKPEFYDFTTAMQGKEKSDKILTEDINQRVLNKFRDTAAKMAWQRARMNKFENQLKTGEIYR